MEHHKIVLLGSGGCGKTTYLQRLSKGTFDRKYIATIGVEVQTIPFNTCDGYITYNIWDTAGQEKFSGLQEGYCVGSKAAIIMFDLTSNCSLKEIVYYIKNYIVGLNLKIPIAFCGTKSDEPNRKITNDYAIDFITKCFELLKLSNEWNYFETSSKSNQNLYEPFLYVTKKIQNDESIYFKESNPIELKAENDDIFKLFHNKQDEYNDYDYNYEDEEDEEEYEYQKYPEVQSLIEGLKMFDLSKAIL